MLKILNSSVDFNGSIFAAKEENRSILYDGKNCSIF